MSRSVHRPGFGPCPVASTDVLLVYRGCVAPLSRHPGGVCPARRAGQVYGRRDPGHGRRMPSFDRLVGGPGAARWAHALHRAERREATRDLRDDVRLYNADGAEAVGDGPLPLRTRHGALWIAA